MHVSFSILQDHGGYDDYEELATLSEDVYFDEGVTTRPSTEQGVSVALGYLSDRLEGLQDNVSNLQRVAQKAR